MEWQCYKDSNLAATFSVVARKVFDIVTSKRIDVVFDDHQDISFKNTEKTERSSGSEGVRYKNIMPEYQMKTWNKLLTISSNKSEYVQFLVSQWKKVEFGEKLGERTMFVTMQDHCWKLGSISCDNVPDLCCNHEEADTRMTLHSMHSGGTSVIHCDDTDVLLLLLSLLDDAI